MKLKIKNFGPLTKGGTIDLDKRFYVFVGKNGSGKTYVANLIYGVFAYDIKELMQSYIEENGLFASFYEKKSIIIDKQTIEELNKINDDLLIRIFGNSNPFLVSKSKITSFHYEDYLKKKLDIKFFYQPSNQGFSFWKEADSNVISWELEEGDLEMNNYDNIVHGGEEKVNTYMVNTLIVNIFISLFFSSNSVNVFLPANRTALLSLWKYIASTERKEKDILFDINSNRKLLSEEELKTFQSLYTKPVKELIDQLEKFDAKSSKPQNYYSDLVEELEELMGGKIKVHEPKEGIGRKRFTFEMAESGEELELFLASSAVNQLSILYIYLKYWAGERANFLMIDEPEINLHPENQVKLVKILMKFADRNNNRVLITTHSTLLADVINNHIRIGYLQTTGEGDLWLNDNLEWLKSNRLDVNEDVDYNDFGVYYFDGNKIKNHAVKDYGVYFKDFAEAESHIQKIASTLKTEIHRELHAKKPN